MLSTLPPPGYISSRWEDARVAYRDRGQEWKKNVGWPPPPSPKFEEESVWLFRYQATGNEREKSNGRFAARA